MEHVIDCALSGHVQCVCKSDQDSARGKLASGDRFGVGELLNQVFCMCDHFVADPAFLHALVQHPGTFCNVCDRMPPH
eukprot:5013378-Lingulodinium_polyedra.AAC.1